MPEIVASVITTFSRRMELRLEDGEVVGARIKGKQLRPVCGDSVTAEQIPGEADLLITGIRDRRNTLTRPNARGTAEVLAANIDQLIVTAAPRPRPDWFIVDRYLAAAESMRASASVVFNKHDLADEGSEPALNVYSDAGYPVLLTSCETGKGFDELENRLAGRTSIFVGQSGVGKSSLINRLLGAQAQKIAAISAKHVEGKHTTVNSRMLELKNGGRVIDSPGVRDFAPFILEAAAVEQGFTEIHAAARYCRFGNCRHLREPGCEVKRRVESAEIDERRYESYRRLLRLTDRLAGKRY